MAQFGDTKSLFDADLLKPGQKLKSNYLKPTNCSIFEALVPKIETEKLFWLLLLLVLVFFSQPINIKLALPQAAQLNEHFIGKSEVLHLHEGPELRTH